MAKKSLKGALVLGALALAGGAYSEGAKEIISQPQDSGKLTTITFPSERKGYEGTPFEYNIQDNLSASETKNSQTTFQPRWFYDIDNDGKWGKAEEDMIKMGYPMYMGNNFDEVMKEIYANQIKANQLESEFEEQPLLYDEYNALKAQHDSAVGKLAESTIAELAKQETYSSLAMSKEEADRIERESQKEMLKRRRHGLRDTPGFQYGLSLAEKLMLSEFNTKEGKRIPCPETNYASNKTEPVKKQYKPSKLELHFEVIGGPGKTGIDSETPTANITGFVGGRVGLVGKVSNWLKIGGAIKGAYGSPEAVSSFQTEPSATGRYFTGSITNGKMAGLGADVEFYLGKKDTGTYFLLGIGPNIWTYEQLDSLKLMNANGEEMASNSDNKVVYKPSIEAYLGLQAQWLRLTAGWDSRKGIFGGIGGVIPLSK